MCSTIQMKSQCCWSNNSALNSSNSLLDSSNSLQECDISCNSLSMNLSAVNHTQRKKLNMKWQCSNTFMSTLQDLNAVLQQIKKKWNLLLMKCWFASVQQEIQTLWCQSNCKMLVNKLIEEKQEIKLSKEQTHSVASVKRSIEEAMNAVIIKRNICPKWLSIYAEKSVQKHLNFVWSIETAFCLTLKNFLINKSKILYVMQFLIEESWNVWYHHQKNVLIEILSWDYFENYLLNLIENSVNCQLHSAQIYIEIV